MYCKAFKYLSPLLLFHLLLNFIYAISIFLCENSQCDEKFAQVDQDSHFCLLVSESSYSNATKVSLLPPTIFVEARRV